VAHVKLADSGARNRPVRHSVNHEAAHSADALAAIVIERDGLFAFFNQLFIDDVQHFEERHVFADISDLVANHAPFPCSLLLPPDV